MTDKLETLRNGATIIEQRGDVVLAKWRGEYVTWVVDGEGNAHWGHYHMQDIVSAAEEFNERVNEYAEREAQRIA